MKTESQVELRPRSGEFIWQAALTGGELCAWEGKEFGCEALEIPKH